MQLLYISRSVEVVQFRLDVARADYHVHELLRVSNVDLASYGRHQFLRRAHECNSNCEAGDRLPHSLRFEAVDV